ncbi:MAG: hypothetical protein LBH81_00725 [Rickettsiales bacterium]|jgi:hypothetical protein|nr:hypothetical protein [Rickettsiales bacterium]
MGNKTLALLLIALGAANAAQNSIAKQFEDSASYVRKTKNNRVCGITDEGIKAWNNIYINQAFDYHEKDIRNAQEIYTKLLAENCCGNNRAQVILGQLTIYCEK